MRQLLALLTLTLLTLTIKAQFPFEKYPALKCKEYYNWKIYDKTEKEKKIHSTMTIPSFFENGDTLTIQLTSFTDHWWENSIIRIFHNNAQKQRFLENMSFNPSGLDTLKVADINGDGLLDVKIVSTYMGCGTASLNVKVIYLFQQPDNSFTKISFDDKLSTDRPERDFDSDGNYEIITMNLVGHENHSYWVFNLFDYKNNGIVNVNSKDNYPIMIQFLYRVNFEITDKINRVKMKDFELNLPDNYDKK